MPPGTEPNAKKPRGQRCSAGSPGGPAPLPIRPVDMTETQLASHVRLFALSVVGGSWYELDRFEASRQALLAHACRAELAMRGEQLTLY